MQADIQGKSLINEVREGFFVKNVEYKEGITQRRA